MLSVLALPLSLVACRGHSGASNDAKTATAASIDALGDSPGDLMAVAAPSDTAGGNADVASRPSCDAAKPHSSGDTSVTMQSGGLERRFLLHIPPSYDGTKSTPLVLNLHGFGSNGRQQAPYSGLPAKADREGFVVASPDGTGTLLHWSYPGLGGVDDVAFIRDLLARLDADLCVDDSRVFVVGISNGAAFAQIVACAMPDRITAVAAVAALVYPRRCATDAPIAVIGFHGTDDPHRHYGRSVSICAPVIASSRVESNA